MTLATLRTYIRIVLKMLAAYFFPVLLFSDLCSIDTKSLLKFTKLLAACCGEQSVMPDTNKSFRKYVHAKTPEELCPNKRHDFLFFVVIVEPAKTNACFIHV
jgi:hypothetical protein